MAYPGSHGLSGGWGWRHGSWRWQTREPTASRLACAAGGARCVQSERNTAGRARAGTGLAILAWRARQSLGPSLHRRTPRALGLAGAAPSQPASARGPGGSHDRGCAAPSTCCWELLPRPARRALSRGKGGRPDPGTPAAPETSRNWTRRAPLAHV